MSRAAVSGARERTRLWPVATFTAAYLAPAAAGAVLTGNQEFVFYTIVLLLLAAAVYGVHRSVELSEASLWALSLWGLLHVAGGLLTVPADWPVAGESRALYELWLVPGRIKFDQMVHAYGFGVTTWVCWQGLRAALRARGAAARPTIGLVVLAAAAGLGFGALNEVVEFVATLLVEETGVGGYRNTGWDLIANLVGATTAAALILAFEGRREGAGSRSGAVSRAAAGSVREAASGAPPDSRADAVPEVYVAEPGGPARPGGAGDDAEGSREGGAGGEAGAGDGAGSPADEDR